ncbi:MAG: exodeoxyribonuclease III [Candidatus Omnitrophica bacterium]|nr:exodeoxyribonuclease III [Candidatus Omnitrophota bacterium]
MRLISWNVNGLRAVLKKDFLSWLNQESPDILCLQETKCHPDQIPPELKQLSNYHMYWDTAEKKGYSGVGVLTKHQPLKVQTGLGLKEFDAEGRTLMLEFPDFVLFNIYFPNGGAGNKRVPFKMAFYDAFLKKADQLKKQGKSIILCGDVNTAHTEIDLSRPKENQKNTGFLPEERAWVSKLISHGYIDTFRHFEKQGGHYSWWDYKTKARERDIGWRIDYFFVSENILPQLKNAFILKQVSGSDHCPVGIEIFNAG